jgi:hypothetical protein
MESLKLGRLTAILCGCLGIGYGIASILVAVSAASALTWNGPARFGSDYSALPTMVVLSLLLGHPFCHLLFLPCTELSIREKHGRRSGPLKGNPIGVRRKSHPSFCARGRMARTEAPHNQERRPRRADGRGQRRTVAETVQERAEVDEALLS